MAPSRGFLFSWPLRNVSSPWLPEFPNHLHNIRRRVSYVSTSFQDSVGDSRNNRQVYISRSLNPYLNLSIEHYLLQKSPPDSTILFLYTNKPCVVIGRNQNPWSEVNLRLLKGFQLEGRAIKNQSRLENVSLVRRRSGGGTVFHDEGNVNYSVICPPSAFNRDKHAEMVVRALQRLGVGKVRVNERHDIVLDEHSPMVSKNHKVLLDNSKVPDQDSRSPVKVSGSAYKLTRLRALHHGTCLLSSPNLLSISSLLRSPARPYIKARGVESVRSPVANLNIENSAFETSVISEFATLYSIKNLSLETENGSTIRRGDNWSGGIVGDECLSIEDISKGTSELMSPEWIYTQTPQFELSSQYSDQSQGTDASEIENPLKKASVYLKVGSGIVSSSMVSTISAKTTKEEQNAGLEEKLMHQIVHEVSDWKRLLGENSKEDGIDRIQVGNWLNSMLGNAG